MPKRHRPRHGSIGYSPRKRAASEVPRFSSWPDISDGPRIQGFAGYKAGMTHALVVDYRKTSTTSGQEVQIPVTVIEVPPMKVAAVRLYKETPYGLKTITEIWSQKLDKQLRRRLPVPKKYDTDKAWKEVDPVKVDEVRVLVYTQPYLVTGVPKKSPDIME
ncbi:MAG: 50S ribosomal protein L3, partial [Candidatus Thermoplasmatota archaeon]|nr:50S ribosomal protein L3 [Candidatus Thermoplasmatota archaeon]